MKKLDYVDVKNYIEGFGYQLVSKEYKNNHTKLKMICPKGHSFEITYSNFQSGKRCPICFGKVKHSYNHIKQYIEGFGYSFVSRKYKNANTKMEMVCPKGHFFEMTYGNFQQGHRCPMCAGKQKHSYNQVKQYIDGFGYQLVSKEYKNNGTKMELVCSEGHLFEISYNCFQQGVRCPECYGNKKHSYNQIKQYIEGLGYSLVSKEYNNNRLKLKMVCPKGHLFKMRFNNFQNGQRCPECAKHLVTSKGEKEIANYIKSIYDGKIIENDRNQIINPLTGKYLELDIFLPDLNKAIEYNGIYWHKDRQYFDETKQQQCQQKRIDLLVVDEERWKHHKNFEEIYDFLNIGGK